MSREPDHGYLAQLVRKVQQGDMTAFSELYAQTYNKVYNYARHYLRDEYAAQDAVQEVYILVLRKIDKIENPLLFIAWLNQISFHVCYDFGYRKTSGYQVMEDEFLSQFYDEAPASNPEASAIYDEELNLLRDAISQLPALQRNIVIMRYYNNMKLTDIADAMDLSLSSVKRYIERAKEDLHSRLKA